jgi:formiminoglutamase
MMTIFDHIHSAESTLFYKRHDKNDVRLGEVVKTAIADYEIANVIILGCPQDDGVKRNNGRLGAAKAPDEIRRALYRLVEPENPNLILFDAGNTMIQPTLEKTHDTHARIIQQMIEDGKRVIALGGGNDLSYADCSGLAQAVDSVLAINVDAHFDVRADTVRNSGTPYRQLLEEGFVHPENFYEVASVPMVNSVTYRNYLLNQNAHIVDLPTVHEQGLQAVFDDILKNDAQAIFWGLDMDAVQVADAPGVSAPNSLGLTAYEFCQLGVLAGKDKRTRIFEITEVNPVYDIDSRTARLAAATIHQFLSNIAI